MLSNERDDPTIIFNLLRKDGHRMPKRMVDDADCALTTVP